MVEMPCVKLVRNDKLFYAPVGADESVMLDSEAGQYFGLNAVGTYIWEQLEQPRTVPELREAVCGEFDVDLATCEADLSEFLRSLIANGMVQEIQA
jgi:hypothetical protein